VVHLLLLVQFHISQNNKSRIHCETTISGRYEEAAPWALILVGGVESLGHTICGEHCEGLVVNRAYFLIWPTVTVTVCYILNRYKVPRQLPKAMALWKEPVFPAASIAASISYPLLAGPDSYRILLSICLVILATLTGILTAVLWRKFISFHADRNLRFIAQSGIAEEWFHQWTGEISENYSGFDISRFEPDNTPADLSTLIDFSKKQPCDLVYEPGVENDLNMSRLFLEAKSLGYGVYDIPTFAGRLSGRIPLEFIDEAWILRNVSTRLEGQISGKLIRIIDLAFGLSFLILSLPLQLAISIAVFVDSGGPVIFKQERLGKYGKPFILYKFRSMIVDAEAAGPQWARKHDSRVTDIGRLLRKTRMDELPQLWNVVLGDISFVGPRPIREHFTNKLAEEFPLYRLRLLVKPGLTGWTQVLGPFGVDMEEEKMKLELDLFYIQYANPVHFLYTILQTGKVILGAKGV